MKKIIFILLVLTSDISRGQIGIVTDEERAVLVRKGDEIAENILAYAPPENVGFRDCINGLRGLAQNPWLAPWDTWNLTISHRSLSDVFGPAYSAILAGQALTNIASLEGASLRPESTAAEFKITLKVSSVDDESTAVKCYLLDPILPSALQENNMKIRPSETKVCGSIIDYKKKILIESIPISGTSFVLNNSSEYNVYSPQSKKLQAEFNLLSNRLTGVRLEISSNGIELLSAPQPTLTPLMKVNFLLNPLQMVGTSNLFTTRYEYQIRVFSPTTVESGGCKTVATIFEGQNVITGTCIAPGIYFATKVDESRTILHYNAEIWGLKGWTVSDHHYFDRQSKTLFTGGGEKETYSNYVTINDPEYGPVNLLIDKISGQFIYVFDQSGRHLETRHAIMNYLVFKFSYGPDNKLLSITDRFNKVTQFIFDSSGKIEKIVAPFGQETLIAANNDSILQVTDPLNHSYVIQYDPNRLITNFQSINGVETTFTYNADGELISEQKSIGLFQSFAEIVSETFKEFSHIVGYGTETTRIEMIEDGRILTKYDSEGRVIAQSTNMIPHNGMQGSTMTTSGGTVYNEQYLNSKIWKGDFTTTSQSTTNINESGQNISLLEYHNETRSYANESNPFSLQLYSRTHLLNGVQTSSIYNTSTRVLTLHSEGKTTNSHFNELGQLVKVEPASQIATYFIYNPQGQLVKIQKGSQFSTFSYDQLGNLAFHSTSNSLVTGYKYDLKGNLIEKTLPNSDKIKYEYSAAGEIKKITAPNNQVHNFQLSIGDYLQTYFTPNNTQTSFIYDESKRLAKIVRPTNREIVYNYKPQSANLESIETPAGFVTFNEIDAQSRLKSVTSADGIKTEISWVDQAIQQQIWYDSDNSIIGKISFNFKSNEMKPREIILNDQPLASLTYNSLGQISSINDVQYTYSNDSVTSDILASSNGTTTSYSVQDQYNGDRSARVVGFNSVEDPTNQLFIALQGATDTFGNSTGFSTTTTVTKSGVTNTYYQLVPQYDPNDRLTQIQKINYSFLNNQITATNDRQNNYRYPANSNNNMKEFTHVSNLGGPQKRTVATHSADDKLLTLRGSIHRDYTYNLDGDLRTMTNCYGTINYTYDVFSNLKKVVLQDGRVIDYKVDGMNRRVKKLVNGVVKEYYLWYDQIHLAAVLDENKNVKIKYIYGPESNSPSYVVKGGKTFRILHDPGLGSIRYVIDETTTQIVQEIEYDEYGNVMVNSNLNFQPLTYAGGLYDSDTKLIRFGARDYDPTIGRWTTKDPIGFAGGDTNLYAYVQGNPMSYNDPTGHCPWCFGAVIGGAVSGYTAYLAGGDMKTVAISAGIGAAAGAASMGISAITTSATGIALANAGLGIGANIGTQLATGTSARNIDLNSAALSGFAGGLGGLAGLGAGNLSFFRTPVVGQSLGVAAARSREFYTSLFVGTAVGTSVEQGLTCH